MCHGFFLGIKCLELQGVSVSYIFLCILQVNKKKKKYTCLFRYWCWLVGGAAALWVAGMEVEVAESCCLCLPAVNYHPLAPQSLQ